MKTWYVVDVASHKTGGLVMAVEDLELVGKEKERALQLVKKSFKKWGLTLPDVPSVPFHFGLHDFHRIGEIEFDINNNVEEGYCGKFIFLLKDQTCPMHYHRIKHETFYMVKGRVKMEAGGESMVMKQGDIKVMPQNTMHRFTGLENSLILECSKPDIMSDSIFEDEAVNEIIARYS